MISESVKRVLKEGHWDSNVYDIWEKVREMVGDDTMLSELYNYMSGDDIQDFLYDHMDRHYELGLENDDEDEDSFE